MSPLQANISGIILPELPGDSTQEKWQQCASEFPWYPLPWLMLAKPDDKESCQKAGLWFHNEQRLHWLLHARPWQEDKWLTQQLNLVKEAAEQSIEESSLQVSILPAEQGDSENQVASFLPLAVPGEEAANISEAESVAKDTTPPQPFSSPKEQPAEVKLDQAPPEAPKSIAVEPIVASRGMNHEPISLKETEKPAATTAETGHNTASKEKQIAEEAPQVVKEPGTKDVQNNTDEIKSIKGIPELPPFRTFKFEPAGATPAKEPLAFEPFYSVDYFASQGIKLEQGTVSEPKEKFDRQLKSFTQWLKTMKQVTPSSEIKTDPEVDARANASVSGEQVITETMAQVLEKQGKYKKAAEIYEKLLLLHPEKSAFFAAQIEELKNKQ